MIKPWNLFLCMMLIIPLALARSPAGMWTTIDDKTGEERALVKLRVVNDTLSGFIINVLNPQPDDTGICSKCPGHFKDKPIKGIEFIWGLIDKGNGEWNGGKILDPKTGKIYRVKMTLKDNKLYVRGYVGFSLLGRTQIWTRKRL